MGLVGVLVRASVTTRLWPSHPQVESRSVAVLGRSIGDLWGRIHTVRSPRLVFIFDDDLAESGGESMAIIVYYCLTNMQCSLANEILELLPAAMRWDLKW